MNAALPQAAAPRPPPVPLAADEVRVWVAALAEHRSPPQLRAFERLLSAAERQRLQRLAGAELRQEYLLTRALCRHVLSLHTGVAPASWCFELNAYGRPSVCAPAMARRLVFNLSNTRSLVVCAATWEADLGVDVECWARALDLEAVAEQVLNDPERRALHDTPPTGRQRRFCQHWTLKEAYVKARGMGLSLPMQAVQVNPLEPRPVVALHAELADDAGQWQFEQVELPGRHLLALALRRGAGPARRLRIRPLVLAGVLEA